MANIEDKYATKAMAEGTFDPRVVEKIHRFSDLDHDKTSQHHSIGPGPSQVASGVHIHDGTETRQLLEGINLTGAKGGSPILASIVAALAALGATDNTTA